MTHLLTEHVFYLKHGRGDGVGEVLRQVVLVVVFERVRVGSVHRHEVIHHRLLKVQQTHHQRRRANDALVHGSHRPRRPAALQVTASRGVRKLQNLGTLLRH